MKTIIITLKKKELLYSVENATYLVGESRRDGTNFEHVSNIQNSGEGNDRDLVLRSIETAFGEVKRNLSRYIDETKAAANNELMAATGDLTLTLTVFDLFNEASTESLKSSAHDYIVNSALRDWFLTVKPDEAEVYDKKRVAANVNMLSALYRKTAPKRPTTP